MLFHRLIRVAAVAAIASMFLPAAAMACACGCGVFDVGTGSVLAGGAGATVFGEFDFLNQRQNWHGTSEAPAADNEDKKIRTDFFTLGAQTMFNRSWGVMAQLPVWNRHFETADSGAVESFDHAAFGDVRLKGIYTGFSGDMSTGVTFGVKLPTGDSSYAGFDADTEIGSGSTDLLLGGYHRGNLTITGSWGYFGQILWQHAGPTQAQYPPRDQLHAAAGGPYHDFQVGKIGVAPTLQLLVSYRDRDGEAAGDPDNTGYTRLLVSPGIALSYDRWKLYSDVEVPVYQYVNGNQLIAPWALKVIASYSF